MFSNTSFGKDLNCPTKALPSHILDRAARLQQLNCRLYLRINNKKKLAFISALTNGCKIIGVQY